MLNYIIFAGIVWGAVKVINKLNVLLGYVPGKHKEAEYSSWEPSWNGEPISPLSLHAGSADSMDRSGKGLDITTNDIGKL